jgi:hypothetical protein
MAGMNGSVIWLRAFMQTASLPTAYLVLPVEYLSVNAMYQGADKSLDRPTSLYISFDASLVIYVNSNNIPPIMIINRMYET